MLAFILGKPQKLPVQRRYLQRKFVVYHRLLQAECFEEKAHLPAVILVQIVVYYIQATFFVTIVQSGILSQCWVSKEESAVLLGCLVQPTTPVLVSQVTN